MNAPLSASLLIAFLATALIADAKPSRKKFAGLPNVVGNIQSISDSDVRRAIAAAQEGLGGITFIRVINRDNVQLHHMTQGNRCEHYDDMKRTKGKWIYSVTVAVVTGCDYRLLGGPRPN